MPCIDPSIRVHLFLLQLGGGAARFLIRGKHTVHVTSRDCGDVRAKKEQR